MWDTLRNTILGNGFLMFVALLGSLPPDHFSGASRGESILCVERVSGTTQIILSRGLAFGRARGGVKEHARIYTVCTDTQSKETNCCWPLGSTIRKTSLLPYGTMFNLKKWVASPDVFKIGGLESSLNRY